MPVTPARLTVAVMVARTIEFVRSWLDRFIDVQGLDRAMALAAQAFGALIPLLIVYNAFVPRGSGKSFADTIINRFDLTGSAAATVREAFSSTQSVESSVSVLGIFLVLISALSFSRGVQRLYEGAYKLPKLGVRNTSRGLGWLLMLVVYVTVRPALAGLASGGAWKIAVSLVLGALAWTVTPYLLLGGRLTWRTLIPGGLLASVGMTILAIGSLIWLPHSITASAEQFGAMGVAFSILSWLFGAGVVLVVTATGGAVITEFIAAPREKAQT